jgi:hypothetical protein
MTVEQAKRQHLESALAGVGAYLSGEANLLAKKGDTATAEFQKVQFLPFS